jgi:hypothetical protein
VTLNLPDLVSGLVGILGRKLTAYVVSIKDVRTIDRWQAGDESLRAYKGAETKLRVTYHIAKLLSDYESHRVIQSWFMGLNPELDDQSPARLLREGDIESSGPAVLRAARAFLAGGQEASLQESHDVFRIGRKPDPWSLLS